MQTIHMNCQDLFSQEKKIECRQLQILLGALRVNVYSTDCRTTIVRSQNYINTCLWFVYSILILFVYDLIRFDIHIIFVTLLTGIYITILCAF